jgi:hypothetical protein
MSETIKEGAFVVPLTDTSRHNNWNGWVLKQRHDNCYVCPQVDPNTGSKANTWFGCGFDLPNSWRYATLAEAAEYERNGGPVRANRDYATINVAVTNYEIY